MKKYYGRYKCIKTPTSYFKKMNGVKKNDFIELNDETVNVLEDSITGDDLTFYYKDRIPFKLVEDNIYHRMDNITGEYLISTNEEYGEKVNYYYFFDYFITIEEHRKNVAKMINDL